MTSEKNSRGRKRLRALAEKAGPLQTSVLAVATLATCDTYIEFGFCTCWPKCRPREGDDG